MATPNYKGRGQPAGESSGWLAQWLGETPSYQGGGQPSPGAAGFGGTAPAYKPAPSSTVTNDVTSNDGAAMPPSQIAIVIPRQLIEQP